MFRVPNLPEMPMSREPMPTDKQRSMRKTPWYATLPHRRGTPVTNTRKYTTAGSTRVRKSKNFPDSKIFTKKTFRIKCVNRDINDFATNASKT